MKGSEEESVFLATHSDLENKKRIEKHAEELAELQDYQKNSTGVQESLNLDNQDDFTKGNNKRINEIEGSEEDQELEGIGTPKAKKGLELESVRKSKKGKNSKKNRPRV